MTAVPMQQGDGRYLNPGASDKKPLTPFHCRAPSLPPLNREFGEDRHRDCRRRDGAANPTRSLFLMIQDLPDDEGFGVVPGRVVVTAEGDETIENDLPRFDIDNVDFRPLHQRAELVKAG